MPRKVRVPQPPTQSRINQQRSRARRREHVTDLERRVREYEARDARASAEMQVAAREVNWKNAQLIELLGSLGWGEEAVERWLRERRVLPRVRLSDPHFERDEGEGEEDGGEYHAMAGMNVENTVRPPQQASSSSSVQEQPSRNCDTDTASERQAGSHEETTSCDEAATMLVSLQGGHTSTTAEVREMLGCCPRSQTEKCQVKNTKLFQLMVETN